MRNPNESVANPGIQKRKYTRRVKQRTGRPPGSISTKKHTGPTAVILRNKVNGFMEYSNFSTAQEAFNAVEGAKKLLSGPNYHFIVLPTEL